jgi:hypothetical protein
MDVLLDQCKGNEGQLIGVLQRAGAPSNIQAKNTSKLRWKFLEQDVVRPSLSPIAQVANDVKVIAEMKLLASIEGFFR